MDGFRELSAVWRFSAWTLLGHQLHKTALRGTINPQPMANPFQGRMSAKNTRIITLNSANFNNRLFPHSKASDITLTRCFSG
jgi:predicted deacylase